MQNQGFSAENSSPTCAVSDGPIKEFSEYQNRLQKDFFEILSSAKSANPNCNAKSIAGNASFVFDAAMAEMKAMKSFKTDFQYNFQYAMKGDKNTAVKRDEKIFETLENRVEMTATQLSQSCGFTSENAGKLITITKEIYTLKELYQNTALGNHPTNFDGIRESNHDIAVAITQAYNPQATVSCNNNSKDQKSFSESLKSAFNFGASKENALSTWKKAIALIRGGGNGMSPSEYASKQRALLSAELSRQGLSANSKKIILQNFDCYKAEMLQKNGSTEDFLSARANCLSAPIAGAEKLFESGKNFGNTISSWKDFTWSTPSTDEIIIREEEKNRRKTRAFNIIEMHGNLQSLTIEDKIQKDEQMKNLIDWHLSLQSTNELLENRISPMQKNCMK